MFKITVISTEEIVHTNVLVFDHLLDQLRY